MDCYAVMGGESMSKQKCDIELPEFAEKFIKDVLLQLNQHDKGTYEHCQRVSEMCLELSQYIGLNIVDQAISMYAGLLHDVGKYKIPIKILNKPDRLTEQEYEIVKKHADYGVEMIQPLTKLSFFQKVSDAILYHHERVDGNGYHRIHTDEIPFHSKIILIVDTVDAMTEDRPYRKGRSFQVACDELIRCSGTQFEPSLVDAFLELHEERLKPQPMPLRKAA